MTASGFTRREFLAATARAGLAAAGAGVVGALPDRSPAAASIVPPWGGGGAVPPTTRPPKPSPITLPPQPSGYRHYATRPDLRPPACTIHSVSGFPFSASQPGYIFSAPRSTSTSAFPAGAQEGVMIQDLRGELVWFQPSPASSHPFDFRVQNYQGKPVLTWFEGTLEGGWAGSGNGFVVDAGYREIGQVRASGYQVDLHELLFTPEGTTLVTAYEKTGSGLMVGHALEVDIPTGRVVWDWACHPAVPLSDTYNRTGDGDYFHINSIDLWPGAARDVLVSARNACAVYLIDRATKQIKWRLGGKRSNFRLGRGVRFWYQHDARALVDGSGLSLFDDASPPAPESLSSGKVITLDQSAMTATLRHQYFHTEAPLDTPREGNLQLLPNGGHVVGWGSSQYFSQFRASGDAMHAQMVLDGRWPANVESYRTYLFDWKGDPPTSELKLLVRPTGGTGRFTAWASWNGATDVAAWRFSAGPSSSSLDEVGTARKRSFETALDFTRVGAGAFQVAAVDRAGRVIARSGIVAAA